MTLHWTEKRAASANVAHALQQGGWHLRGYHADQSDSQSDYSSPASWMDGIATHPNYPGVVVGFAVSATSAEKRSGTDQMTTTYERAEDCTACGGSGHDRDAPPTTCTASAGDGAHTKTEPASCAICHGRGYLVTRVNTVLFTWPTFHGTPRGNAWHVEYAGQIIASGTGFQRAASHRDGPAAAQSIATEIASIARRCAGHPAPASGESAATAAAPTPTTASRNGVTITCTYTVKNGSVWTWLAIAPRIARNRYDVIKARFGIRSSRTRRALSMTQQVDAADILAVLEPDPAPVTAHDDATDAAELPEPAEPAALPEMPSVPPALTFTVDAITFKNICDACASSSILERGRVRGYVHAGRFWATSGTWTGSAGAGAWASEIVPRNEWIGEVSIPERYSGSFKPGTVATAGRLGDVVITAQTATFLPEPTPTPDSPPALAGGQRWTLDIAFQTFDDGTIDALRARDLAHRFVGLSLDAPALTIAGATITGDHCTCTEKAKTYGLTCRHVLAVRLLRQYHAHAL